KGYSLSLKVICSIKGCSDCRATKADEVVHFNSGSASNFAQLSKPNCLFSLQSGPLPCAMSSLNSKKSHYKWKVFLAARHTRWRLDLLITNRAEPRHDQE